MISAMRPRIVIAFLSSLYSCQALACSPPVEIPALSNEEIVRATRERIEQADVIIDGIVTESRDGRLFLKPIKVWKGNFLHAYYIENADCGIFLSRKSKVRALLEEISSPSFIMMSPLVGDDLKTDIYDRTIDAHLGKDRPKNFENGGLPQPPPP